MDAGESVRIADTAGVLVCALAIGAAANNMTMDINTKRDVRLLILLVNAGDIEIPSKSEGGEGRDSKIATKRALLEDFRVPIKRSKSTR